jgi:hypothetical protein
MFLFQMWPMVDKFSSMMSPTNNAPTHGMAYSFSNTDTQIFTDRRVFKDYKKGDHFPKLLGPEDNKKRQPRCPNHSFSSFETK